MEAYEFGKENSRKIVLIPGNMMCWKQYKSVIPLLEQHFHVIAISTDGYDGTGKTTFTTAENAAEKLEAYIKEKLPWMLRVYTRGDDEKLLNQFKYAPNNISLETLKNCVEESLSLYEVIDGFEPWLDAKVSIWYGEKEPNMKKAIKKLKRAFPSAEAHPFAGYGHGEIMSHPEERASAMSIQYIFETIHTAIFSCL